MEDWTGLLRLPLFGSMSGISTDVFRFFADTDANSPDEIFQVCESHLINSFGDTALAAVGIHGQV